MIGSQGEAPLNELSDALRRQMEAATGLEKELLKEQLQQIEYPPAKAFWAEEGRNGIQFDESGFLWIRLFFNGWGTKSRAFGNWAEARGGAWQFKALAWKI